MPRWLLTWSEEFFWHRQLRSQVRIFNTEETRRATEGHGGQTYTGHSPNLWAGAYNESSNARKAGCLTAQH